MFSSNRVKGKGEKGDVISFWLPAMTTTLTSVKALICPSGTIIYISVGRNLD